MGTKISALTTITGANTAAGDLLAITDVSDTTQGAGGTTKSITRDQLMAAGGPATFGATNVSTLAASGAITGSGTVIADGVNGFSSNRDLQIPGSNQVGVLTFKARYDATNYGTGGLIVVTGAGTAWSPTNYGSYMELRTTDNGATVPTVKATLSSTGLAVTGAIAASTTGKVGTTLGVGNATPSASGAGITFPATQSASTDPNTLDDYREFTFTATATGMTTAPTGTATVVRAGNNVTMEIPAITGTSNATTFTLTGGPTTMRPSATRTVTALIQDNTGATSVGLAQIGTDGVITLFKDVAQTAFTSSGTKATAAINVSYVL